MNEHPDDMPERPPRVQELLGGAVTGDLDENESQELARLLERRPHLREELESLRMIAGVLPDRGRWSQELLPNGLRGRVLASTADESARPGPRRVLLLSAAALVLVTVGAVAGFFGGGVFDRPVTGPPGTMGALEPVRFSESRTGVEVEASVMPHTWGTETFLDIDGLPAGEVYEVVFIGHDGTQHQSGSFFGSDVTITCQLNAAVNREDVRAIELRTEDGQTIAVSRLADVG